METKVCETHGHLFRFIDVKEVGMSLVLFCEKCGEVRNSPIPTSPKVT